MLNVLFGNGDVHSDNIWTSSGVNFVNIGIKNKHYFNNKSYLS